MNLPEGHFAILAPEHFGRLSTAQVIEAFLDAESIPFIARDKSKSLTNYTQWIAEIDELKNVMAFDYIIHHHIELVKNSSACGVHLTAQSLPVAKARELLGPEMVIGYSAHSVPEAITAKQNGADYVFLGSIFATKKTQTGHPLLGLEALREASKKLDIPVYAIGGVEEANILTVRETGVAGFAALAAIYKDGEIEHNISKLNFMWHDF